MGALVFHGGLDGSATEKALRGMKPRRGAGLPIAAAAPPLS
ncbi:hypothetical protein CSB85_4622 [Pseudomonas aeruginosa]|nr:hypothetical protein CSB97_4316 [Pseudomonas aeruginosa]AVK23555.1 hypothetical protein CSB85_4622 [Pseudomonas aeruginosa]AWE76485.1 hypothetical protein CSC31_4718 [Pseudomonas aeruginosa]AWF00932.1 hypothetical protein CSC26_0893 [Pseudomonas aeruginosa]AWZ92441.1 hypothetical protein CSC46_3293 [Pseudomonas aeruginosa]